MQAYQRKVLAFLVKQCYEEYLSWGNDEMEVEGLTLEEREHLTKDLEDTIDSEGETLEVFSITSLCHLAEGWLTSIDPTEQDKHKPA